MDMSPPMNLSSGAAPTAITDLDVDALAHCARHLTLQDVSNIAMSCKFLKGVAYSDLVWHHLFRERWPQLLPSRFTTGVRETYLARLAALQQFQFADPLVLDIHVDAKPYHRILLNKNFVFLTKGSSIEMLKIRSSSSSGGNAISLQAVGGNALNEHNANITCMRIFPLSEASLFRSDTGSKENFIVTSSCDRSIRVWWKGACQRCFKGHSGPVLTFSDELLGDESGKLMASGGDDGTVRVWSLSSGGRRGQQALKATFYGHGKPVKFVSVSGYKTSLLVSMSSDSKIRVWDVSSSERRSSRCVGMTCASGAPLTMKCHESMVYVAAGSHAIAIDLRTMQSVATLATTKSKLYSFNILPSKSLICTGEDGRALLWDIRKNQARMKPEPVAELEGHTGPVTHLHMDPYKIVTGGNKDTNINIWEADRYSFANSLSCCSAEDVESFHGCSAMAVDGCRIVTAAHGQDSGIICFRDFENSSSPVSANEEELSSKFWGHQSYSDGIDSD